MDTLPHHFSIKTENPAAFLKKMDFCDTPYQKYFTHHRVQHVIHAILNQKLILKNKVAKNHPKNSKRQKKIKETVGGKRRNTSKRIEPQPSLVQEVGHTRATCFTIET